MYPDATFLYFLHYLTMSLECVQLTIVESLWPWFCHIKLDHSAVCKQVDWMIPLSASLPVWNNWTILPCAIPFQCFTPCHIDLDHSAVCNWSFHFIALLRVTSNWTILPCASRWIDCSISMLNSLSTDRNYLLIGQLIEYSITHNQSDYYDWLLQIDIS